jgi:hypothetical protein
VAIDTREKRASVLGVARPWMRDKLPAANSERWRISSGNAYCGNALSATVTTDPVLVIDFEGLGVTRSELVANVTSAGLAASEAEADLAANNNTSG